MDINLHAYLLVYDLHNTYVIQRQRCEYRMYSVHMYNRKLEQSGSLLHDMHRHRFYQPNDMIPH